MQTFLHYRWRVPSTLHRLHPRRIIPLLLLALCVTGAKAADVPTVPTSWKDVKFNGDIRYSQWVINSRISDFYANQNQRGFNTYDKNGTPTGSSKGTQEFDYVPGLVSVVQNINKKQTNVVMGSKTRVLYGPESIKDSLGSLSFHISAQAFFQVNSEQAEKLYNKALEFAALSGKETVVDVYCGTGTISLYLARHAKQVYGIEIVAPAIENAKKNAEENKCANAEFICGDAAVELPKLLAGGVRPDVLVVDPPRAGCEQKVLAAIAEVQPERVVYVSCNPASLARDLAFMEQHGYKAIVAQPVDMFPMTSHVECVTLLTRS